MPATFDRDRAILFPHIPRTAGSTLKHQLRAVVGTDRSRLDVHRYEPLRAEELDRVALVEGHKRAPYFAGLCGPSWTSNGLTMLRDPVARVVSQARHIRSSPGGERRNHLAPPLAPLDEVFDKVSHLCNLQTRMLSNHGTRGEHSRADLLDGAKATLDSMAFGLTESFEVSLALFAERFDLLLPLVETTSNASPRHGDRDLCGDDFRAEAERHNALDVQLYRYAKTLFDERASRYAGSLLALPLDEAPFSGELLSDRLPVDNGVSVHGWRRAFELEGWMLVGDEAPDAVLLRIGGRTIPLVCGRESPKVGRRNRRRSNLYAGVAGRADVPDDVSSFEIVGIDRQRGRRAQRTFPIRHQNAVAAAGTLVASATRRGLRLARIARAQLLS